MPKRRATVETPGEWQCKIGGVRRLALANGPNIFQMLLVCSVILTLSGRDSRTCSFHGNTKNDPSF